MILTKLPFCTLKEIAPTGHLLNALNPASIVVPIGYPLPTVKPPEQVLPVGHLFDALNRAALVVPTGQPFLQSLNPNLHTFCLIPMNILHCVQIFIPLGPVQCHHAVTVACSSTPIL